MSYKGGYQTIPRDLSELRALADKDKYRLDLILKYKDGGRLLEIGPWIGIFCCNAKDAGFEVTAVEMDPRCIAFLEDVVGIKAVQSINPAAALDMMQETFDVIVLWHSLEHLPEPWLVLQKAAEKLASGGTLVIAVPNIESHEFLTLEAEWFHLDAPRHLYFYPSHWLKQVCEQNGLKAVEFTTTDKLSRILSLDAWYKKASSRLPVPYVRGVFARLLYLRARFLSKRAYSGSGLTAVFRKII